jgi:hypothetical protein
LKDPKSIQLLTKDQKRSKAVKDISSKDLTRKELFLYIFSDFFRISYIVLCLFIDALILGLQVFNIDDSIFNLSKIGGSYLPYYYMYVIYLFLIIMIMEIIAIPLELKLYRKVFYKPLLNPKFR